MKDTTNSAKQLDLSNAEDCRWYIDHLEHPRGKITFVEMNDGRRVDFHNMSVADAVTIANQLYQMELEGNMRAKDRIIDEGGLIQ